MDGTEKESKSDPKLQLPQNEGLPVVPATKVGVSQPTNGPFLGLQDSITWPPSGTSSTGKSTKPKSDSDDFQPAGSPPYPETDELSSLVRSYSESEQSAQF